MCVVNILSKIAGAEQSAAEESVYTEARANPDGVRICPYDIEFSLELDDQYRIYIMIRE